MPDDKGACEGLGVLPRAEVPEDGWARCFLGDQEIDKLIPRVLFLKVQGQSMKTRVRVKASVSTVSEV